MRVVRIIMAVLTAGAALWAMYAVEVAAELQRMGLDSGAWWGAAFMGLVLTIGGAVGVLADIADPVD